MILSKPIFISHAKKDEYIVEMVVEQILTCGIGVPKHNVFCTSMEGLGVELSADWRSAIKNALNDARVVLLLITPNYRESEMCLYEMGAAWANSETVIPIVFPGVTYNDMGVVVTPKQAVSLNNDGSWDDLRDFIPNDCCTDNTKLPTAAWNNKKLKALTQIRKYIESNPFSTPLTRMTLEKTEKELAEMVASYDLLLAEKESDKKYINELESKKDKADVADAQEKVGRCSGYDVFMEKVRNFKKALEKLNRAVCTAIFCHLKDGSPLTYSREYYDYIQSAVNDGYIDEDGKLNKDERLVKKALSAFDELETYYYSEDFCEDTINRLEEEYPTVDFSTTRSKKFWENIFGIYLL